MFTGSRCDIRVSYCASGPCLNGASCIDTQFGFVCTCASGYTGTNCATLINVSLLLFNVSLRSRPLLDLVQISKSAIFWIVRIGLQEVR